jgi:serine/threonine protein kinase
MISKNKNYKTIKELGKGGMATVYLARDLASNQLVAVKVLKTDTLLDKEYIKRFFREARITAQLDHPNIIRVMESNFSQGLFYIVTEYLEGGDFSQLMPSSPRASTKVSLREKLKILNKVLLALDYAHQKGIVHRDIKPSNILLTKTLEPKLSDFGIATALWGQDSRYTQTNEVVGTMDYIAPEQKESSKAVDLRADIYSVGVILYQLITGRKPQGAFPPPGQVVPSLPARLDGIVMKCLQPFPADRYKNARNLAREIEEALSLPGTPAEKLETAAQGIPASGNHNDHTQISHPPPDPFASLVEKMRSGSVTQKIDAKTRLINFADASHQEKLLQLLTEPETGGVLKEAVIQALGRTKYKKACTHLVELLSDPYYNKFAAGALGEIGCEEAEAEEKLFNMLLTNNEISYIALIPLGKLNSISSIDLIAQYLTHRHTWIREMALEALAMIRSPRVTHHLENAAHHNSDANIRAKAKKNLWRLKK